MSADATQEIEVLIQVTVAQSNAARIVGRDRDGKWALFELVEGNLWKPISPYIDTSVARRGALAVLAGDAKALTYPHTATILAIAVLSGMIAELAGSVPPAASGEAPAP